MKYERAAKLDARIDTETGEFDMVMATEGEASDGHIISIRGLGLDAEIPLQLDHNRSAVANLGTVGNFRKESVDGVPAVRGTGRVRLTGDGDALAARRDLVDAISVGDVSGVSLTWEGVKAHERRSLPKDHHAHVNRGEPDPRKRFGLFFAESRAIEQSIVGIPADRNALIGRSEGAEDDVSRAMWQSLVDRFNDSPMSREAEIIAALEGQLATLEERVRAAEALHDEAESDTYPDLPAIDALLEHVAPDWRARTDAELGDVLGEAFQRITGRSYDGR